VNVVAYVPDLMDRSRISGAGASVSFVPSPEALLVAGADLVVVDLNRSGVLDVIGQLAIPVIGYASHVDRDLLAAARAAGCGTVLARSAFFSRVAELLAGRPEP
jgi:hypothetical protein